MPILKIAKNKKYPIYIILGYQNYNEAIKMIEKNKENIFIFGYAGFPHFKSFWIFKCESYNFNWFNFIYFGHNPKLVHVLNGGLKKWIYEKRKLSLIHI